MEQETHDRINGILKLVLPAISIIFTSYLMIELIGTDTYIKWILIGVISVSINFLELRWFYLWKKEGRDSYAFLGVLVGIASVIASLGALQVGFERGIMESQEYQIQSQKVDLLKRQIENLGETADRQQQINHITRSAQTLEAQTPLFSQLGMEQEKLSEIKSNGAGVGGALYRLLSRMFKTELLWIAVIINLFISAIIEIGAIDANIKDVEYDPVFKKSRSEINKEKKRQQLDKAVDKKRQPLDKKVDIGKSTVDGNGKFHPSSTGQQTPSTVSKQASIITLLDKQRQQGNVNYSEVARQLNVSREYVRQVDKKNQTIGFKI